MLSPPVNLSTVNMSPILTKGREALILKSFMAKQIQITPFKLSKKQKQGLADYISGKHGVVQTALHMGIPRTRLYTMITALTRHSCKAGKIDINALLKDY